jgi:hypothetical protein
MTDGGWRMTDGGWLIFGDSLVIGHRSSAIPELMI